jgi:hypothetical protein
LAHRYGTVVGFGEGKDMGKYGFRVDNRADAAATHIDPSWDTMVVRSHQYAAADRLAFCYKRGTKMAHSRWVRCTVIEYLGHGSRHRVRLDTGDLATEVHEVEVEVDFNEHNHIISHGDSGGDGWGSGEQQGEETGGATYCYVTARAEYVAHVKQTWRSIVDLITGVALDVEKELVNMKLVPEGTVESGEVLLKTNAIDALANVIASDSRVGRTSGGLKSHAVLIRAAPGTGKSWGMQKVALRLAQIDSAESLPLLITVQELARMLSSGSTEGANLIEWYIGQKFGDRPSFVRMLVESYRARALVVILDGVDEAASLKSRLWELILDELVPPSTTRENQLRRGLRLIVTSRPEGVPTKGGILRAFRDTGFQVSAHVTFLA